MYTRCPSCRAEISFEPPRNLANLPQGYKHRIRCPNCGVTISVKMPDSTAVAKTAPTYSYQDPDQQGYDEIRMGEGTVQDKGEARDISKAKKNSLKKKCRPRSAVMLVFSLIFVALNVLAYLDVQIPKVSDYISWQYFNGIKVIENIINDAAGFAAGFTGGDMVALVGTIFSLLPALIFVLAGIVALMNLIGLIIGKYGKTFNIIMIIIVLLASVAFFVVPYIALNKGLAGQGASYSFKDYFDTIFGKYNFPPEGVTWTPIKVQEIGDAYAKFIELEDHTYNLMHLVVPGLGFIYFVLGIVACAIPKKRKEKVAE